MMFTSPVETEPIGIMIGVESPVPKVKLQNGHKIDCHKFFSSRMLLVF